MYERRVVGAVGLGGLIGTLGRYGVGLLWPTGAGAFPIATFVVNTSGAFAIGFALTLILERFPSSRYLRPALCVGLLGGWTTMSTFATEADVLVKDGYIGQALFYVLATLIAGVVATVAGIAIARLRVDRS